MSELTTDMVWFINKEITLADGRKVTALVPPSQRIITPKRQVR